MKVIKNTLEPVIERWDDPGDYPNGLAGGPLPSKDFVYEIEGSITVQLDEEEMREAVEFYVEDRTDDIDHNLPDIRVRNWVIEKITGNQVTFYVEEFEER